MLESISDGILVIDQCGRLLLINRAMWTLIGQSPREVVGRRLLWLLHAPAADGIRLLSRAALRQVLVLFDQHAGNTAGQSEAARSLHGTPVLTDGRSLIWGCAPLVALGNSEGYVVTYPRYKPIGRARSAP